MRAIWSQSCRSLDHTIATLDQELERRAAELVPALLTLPGCGAISVAKLLAEIGPANATSEGKSWREAIRCHKRLLVRVVRNKSRL